MERLIRKDDRPANDRRFIEVEGVRIDLQQPDADICESLAQAGVTARIERRTHPNEQLRYAPAHGAYYLNSEAGWVPYAKETTEDVLIID